MLEIVIEIDKDTRIGGLKIWNYNKSSLDCTKGVKEVEILINDSNVWQGRIESGRGQTSVEYATAIALVKDIAMPKEVEERKNEIIVEAYEEEESKDEINPREKKLATDRLEQEEMKKYKS